MTEVIVETTTGSHRAGLAGTVPVPATEAKGDALIEAMLGIGNRIAAETGSTLLRVKWNGGSVEWFEDSS